MATAFSRQMTKNVDAAGMKTHFTTLSKEPDYTWT